MIAELQEQWLKDDFRITPTHTNRASSAGHPCARYLTYCRTHWQQRSVPDVYLMSIFKHGWMIEDVVFSWLKDKLKLDCIQPKDRDLSWPHLQLTGHLDAYLNEDGVWVPLEIKSVSDFTWDNIRCFDDMKHSKAPWVAKWRAQLLLYMLLENKSRGRYVFMHKESGLLRDFPVVLEENLSFVEEVLKRLELVNQHVAAGTLPDRIYGDGAPSTLCERCDFGHVCLPGSCYDEALKLMIDPQVEALLQEEQELKATIKMMAPQEARLDDIKKKLMIFFKDKPRVMVGNFVVTGSVVNKKAMDATSYWLRKVKVV